MEHAGQETYLTIDSPSGTTSYSNNAKAVPECIGSLVMGFASAVGTHAKDQIVKNGYI